MKSESRVLLNKTSIFLRGFSAASSVLFRRFLKQRWRRRTSWMITFRPWVHTRVVSTHVSPVKFPLYVRHSSRRVWTCHRSLYTLEKVFLQFNMTCKWKHVSCPRPCNWNFYYKQFMGLGKAKLRVNLSITMTTFNFLTCIVWLLKKAAFFPYFCFRAHAYVSTHCCAIQPVYLANLPCTSLQ